MGKKEPFFLKLISTKKKILVSTQNHALALIDNSIHILVDKRKSMLESIELSARQAVEHIELGLKPQRQRIGNGVNARLNGRLG